jgi:hypothetical protein
MSASSKLGAVERFKRLYGATADPATEVGIGSCRPTREADRDGTSDSAEKTLELLGRLKLYALPSGRMPVARKMALELHGLTDTATMLTALQKLERQLIILGGAPDPALAELAEGIAMVEQAFSGTKLITVRKLQ